MRFSLRNNLAEGLDKKEGNLFILELSDKERQYIQGSGYLKYDEQFVISENTTKRTVKNSIDTERYEISFGYEI